MISFKEWVLIKEGGKGSGTKKSATGLMAGGQAQAAIGMYKPAKPQLKLVKRI
jgi:hypothetical protein